MIKLTKAVTVSATIELDEEALRALEALVGYGIEPFLQVYYEKLGTAYLRPYEGGLRKLFVAINATVPQALAQAKEARKLMMRQHEEYTLLLKRRELQALERKLTVGEDAGLTGAFNG